MRTRRSTPHPLSRLQAPPGARRRARRALSAGTGAAAPLSVRRSAHRAQLRPLPPPRRPLLSYGYSPPAKAGRSAAAPPPAAGAAAGAARALGVVATHTLRQSDLFGGERQAGCPLLLTLPARATRAQLERALGCAVACQLVAQAEAVAAADAADCASGERSARRRRYADGGVGAGAGMGGGLSSCTALALLGSAQAGGAPASEAPAAAPAAAAAAPEGAPAQLLGAAGGEAAQHAGAPEGGCADGAAAAAEAAIGAEAEALAALWACAELSIGGSDGALGKRTALSSLAPDEPVLLGPHA